MKIGSKVRVTGVVIAFCSMISATACASELSVESKADILESLRKYKPIKTKKTLSSLEAENERCKDNHWSASRHCLEKKYMKDGYYVVRIGYRRDAKIPVQPSAPYILGSHPLRKDTAKQDAFLKEWSDPVFREYIGNDYHKFNSIELIMVNKRNVLIGIEVRDAAELVGVLMDSRIFSVRHIGNPRPKLEEIAI